LPDIAQKYWKGAFHLFARMKDDIRDRPECKIVVVMSQEREFQYSALYNNHKILTSRLTSNCLPAFPVSYPLVRCHFSESVVVRKCSHVLTTRNHDYFFVNLDRYSHAQSSPHMGTRCKSRVRVNLSCKATSHLLPGQGTWKPENSQKPEKEKYDRALICAVLRFCAYSIESGHFRILRPYRYYIFITLYSKNSKISVSLTQFPCQIALLSYTCSSPHVPAQRRLPSCKMYMLMSRTHSCIHT
jgi:hypothetical protein